MVLSPIIRLVGKIATVVVYLLTIASAFGGWCNPRISAIPSMLNLAFPWFAILTIILTAAWLFGQRWFIGALGVVTIIACWTPLGMAVPLHFSKKASPKEKTFTLLSYNILHMEDQKNPDLPGERVLRFLLETDADIVSVQEFFAYDPDKPGTQIALRNPVLWQDFCRKYPYQSMGQGRNDLSVFSKYPFEKLDLSSPDQLNPQCYGFFRIKIGNHTLTLANLHLISFALSDEERDVISRIHNSKTAKLSLDEFRGDIRSKMAMAYVLRDETVSEVLNALKDISGPLIAAGDFNDVPSSWTYRRFLNAGFKDAYTETSFGPTWTYNAHLMYFHLDQILYRGALKPLSVKRFKIDTSDHYPLLATFAFSQN
ncbi:MAG: endonuclease/exonuclease/phosphatase family protein [Muribaculum sp.]|nr:endonuclease/exonuclease/phosphatase family protein [Muribaculum sp.]